jgi:transposase-like protein
MKKSRRQYSAKEKVKILRFHLLEQKPVSDVCDQYGLHPTMFYRWQKEFFEHGAAAFERNNNGSASKKLERQNAQLKAKIAQKDEVIAEIMADHVRLKKELGLD